MLKEARWSEHPNRSCKGEPLDRFFPTPKYGVERPGWNRALETTRALCFVCPVQDECLEYATEQLPNSVSGIWGGVYFGGGPGGINKKSRDRMIAKAEVGIHLPYSHTLKQTRRVPNTVHDTELEAIT